MSSFAMKCVMGIKDGSGIVPGTPGYSGPLAGDVYEVTLFQKTGPKDIKRTMDKNLLALRTCLGWDEAKMAMYQETDQGFAIVTQLIEGLLCYSIDTGVGTEQPCVFAGQVVVIMSAKTSIVEQKDASGQPVFDANQQKITKVYTNEYWDGKVPLAVLPQLLGSVEAAHAAMGSQAAYDTALGMEQQLDTMQAPAHPVA